MKRKKYISDEVDHLDFELRLKRVYKKRYVEINNRPDWNYNIVSNINFMLKYEAEDLSRITIFFNLEKECIESPNTTCNFSLFTKYCKYLKSSYNKEEQDEQLQIVLNSLLERYKEKYPLWFSNRRFKIETDETLTKWTFILNVKC